MSRVRCVSREGSKRIFEVILENKENKNDGKRNLWDSILAIASIVAIIVATIAIFQTNNILKLTQVA